MNLSYVVYLGIHACFVGFCRRFPTVDRKWLASFRRQEVEDDNSRSLQISLPSDAQIEKALAFRKLRYVFPKYKLTFNTVSGKRISVLQ
jgi:hypothetical protein